MSERRSRSHRLREVALTTGAVLGAVSVLLAIAASLFSVTPLVFRSGSMSPAIDTGDLGIARTVAASDLRVGDIVSVTTSSGTRVTHRVIDLEPTDDGAVLTLQGDTNATPDPERYDVTEADRVMFSVPRLGYVAAWLGGPGGMYLGACVLAAVMLVLLSRPNLPSKPAAGRRRADTAKRTTTLALGAVLLTLPALSHSPQAVDTLAAWNDPVSVTGASFTGYTVPAPAYNQTCTTGGSGSSQTIAYSWPANVAPLPLLSYDIVVSGITATSSVSAAGSTTTVTVSFSTTSANRNQLVTLTAVAWPTGGSAWKSAATTTWKFRTNGNNAAATCGEIDPPTVTYNRPVNGTTYTRTTLLTALVPCGTAPACGSLVDASLTNATAQFSLVRNRAGAIACWNSSTWITTSCSTTYFNATMSGGNWSVGGTQTGAYPVANSTGTYTLTVLGTDYYGNVTTPASSITFTVN